MRFAASGTRFGSASPTSRHKIIGCDAGGVPLRAGTVRATNAGLALPQLVQPLRQELAVDAVARRAPKQMLADARTEVLPLGSPLQSARRWAPNSLRIRVAAPKLDAQFQPELGFTHRFHFILRLLFHSHVLLACSACSAQGVTSPAARSSSSQQ